MRLLPATIGALALLLVPTALADPPSRDPLPPPPGTSFTISGICSFDVQVTFDVNKEYLHTFTNGAQVITGALFATVTNLSNGKSTSLNISGPGFSSVTSNQLTFSGTSLIIVNPGGLGPGAPGAMLLTHGPATATFDNTGAIVALDLTSASTTDLCATLS